MIKVGLTGQQGFIGKHLYNTLGLEPQIFERIEFNRSYFDNVDDLAAFVSKCDVIVHLAAMNRHNDQEVIYEVNVGLVKKLEKALERTNSKAHVIFSSSSQEERDNLYGKSKKDGRSVLANWAKRTSGTFTGLIIPNVFGPFGHPFYNSFIATFSHQLTHHVEPGIESDGDVALIYINDLIKLIIDEIKSPSVDSTFYIPANDQKKVSEVLDMLKKFKSQYFDAGVIPALTNGFEINLFNTFRSYIDISSNNLGKFIKHVDDRGAFVEVIRLNVGGQVSFSTTKPGITRGNHFHTRKIERFAVIKGNALIQLRKIGTEEIHEFHLSGDEPGFVDMPIWYTHNIKNTGSEELFTIFWINEFFDPEDSDTFFETV